VSHSLSEGTRLPMTYVLLPSGFAVHGDGDFPNLRQEGAVGEAADHESERRDLIKRDLLERDSMMLLEHWGKLALVAGDEEFAESLEDVLERVVRGDNTALIQRFELADITADAARTESTQPEGRDPDGPIPELEQLLRVLVDLRHPAGAIGECDRTVDGESDAVGEVARDSDRHRPGSLQSVTMCAGS
jgi:hypothetical protein